MIRTGYPCPVAYTYMAATHCPECTEKAFGVDDSGFVPAAATDAEGNGIGAIAPWETSEYPEGIYCDDCGVEVSEPFHDPNCTGCEHDCPWKRNPIGAPFCSICDDHTEASA